MSKINRSQDEKDSKMVSVKEHYDNLLAEHYTWMCGGFETKVRENVGFFGRTGIVPRLGGRALDLGCGSGFQSVALADLGFKVFGVDQCAGLLAELRGFKEGRKIDAVQGDMLDDKLYSDKGPFEVAVCMGDTLTHLPKVEDVMTLLERVYSNLEYGGSLALTFRDFTSELAGIERIIPVRTDEDRLMAVFLEYEETHVNVHDLIFVKDGSGWSLKKSVYKKLRLGLDQLRHSLEHIGYKIDICEAQEGFAIIVAQK